MEWAQSKELLEPSIENNNEDDGHLRNDYGRLAHLKPLNGTTRNACVPIRLYNINLQIRENHSTNHCIAFPMDGSVWRRCHCVVHVGRTGGGEEDAFGFGRCGLATNVHFQAKSAEVVKDEVHALFEVFS